MSRPARLWLGVCVIAVLFLALRLPGITWGLPGAVHNWPYWVDEVFPFKSLAQMSWQRRDFDPKQPRGGHAYIYTVGTLLLGADATGYLALPRDVQELKRPGRGEQLRRSYLVVRLLSLAADLFTVILIGLLAARWGGVAGGWLAAGLAATAPFLALTAHFGSYYPLVMTTIAASFWLLARACDARRARVAFLAGAVLGYGVSSMWLTGLMASAALFLLLDRERRRLAGWYLGGVVFVFALTAPYLWLHPIETLAGVRSLQGSYGPSPSRLSFARAGLFFTSTAAALTWLVPLLALAGLAVLAARRRLRAEIVTIGPFLLAVPAMMLIGTGLARHYAILYPGLLALAGVALGALPRRWRSPLGSLAVIFTAWCSLGMIWPLVATDPRTAAGDWVRTNVPAGSRFVGFNWYSVPHLPLERYPTTMLWRDFADSHALVPHEYVLVSDQDGVMDLVARDTAYERIAVFRQAYPCWLGWTVAVDDPGDLTLIRPEIAVFRRLRVDTTVRD